MASGVAADEVRDNLLTQVLLAVDAVEDALELMELAERRLAHEHEHAVTGMFGSHLQASADVSADEFARIFHSSTVGCLVLAAVEQEIVAHATSYEALLDTRQGVDSAVDLKQSRVVGIEVGAYLRMDAAGTLAAFAGIEVAPVHAVHVGRRASEVGEIALEVRHLDDLFHFLDDALLGATGDELPLMGRYGAEGTASEAATMDVHAVLDHVERRYALALVLRMWLSRIRKVERGVELGCGHGWIGRVDYHIVYSG